MNLKLTILLLLTAILAGEEVLGQRTAADSLGLDSLWSGFLEPVTIRPDMPDTVYGDDLYNVCDFVFTSDAMVLLVYGKEERWKRQEDSKKTLFKDASVLVMKGDSIAFRIPVEGLVLGLVHHPVFGVFVEGYTDYFLLDLAYGLVADKVESSLFISDIRPIVDSCRGYTLVSTYSDMLPFMDFYLSNRYTQQQSPMAHIDDGLGRELFMSEYKYLHPKDKVTAMNYELEHGVQKEIAAAFMNGFQYSNYFEKLNVPAFLHKNTWVVFDHPNNQISRYFIDGEKIEDVKIEYQAKQQGKKWSEKIIHDEVGGDFYSTWLSHGKTIVAKLNLDTGKFEAVKTLYFNYCEQVKVVNGDIYYIYRPFESSQKRFLYKESIFAKP